MKKDDTSIRPEEIFGVIGHKEVFSPLADTNFMCYDVRHNARDKCKAQCGWCKRYYSKNDNQ